MREAGVTDAALMAGVGVGVFGSLKEAVRDFVPFDETFAPRAEMEGRHAARFRAYRVAYEQLRVVRG